MNDFVLHSYLSKPDTFPFSHSEEKQGEDIITAIRNETGHVYIIKSRISDSIDNNYLLEVCQLPDYNCLSSTKKAVLAAYIRYLRQRLYPLTKKIRNVALWDLCFLQYLHSTILKAVSEVSYPRLMRKYLDYAQKPFMITISGYIQVGLEVIYSGDVHSLSNLVSEASNIVQGFALLQLSQLQGWTLLHYAVSCKHLAAEQSNMLIEAICSFGVGVNSVDYRANTALHIACQHHNYSAISILSQHPLTNLNTRNVNNQIPLQVFIGRVRSNSATSHQEIIKAIKLLIPYDDYMLLLSNSSLNSFQPCLLPCLLHQSREIGYFCLNQLTMSLRRVAGGGQRREYEGLVSVLDGCVKHGANFFYSQIIDLIRSLEYGKADEIEFELFSLLICSGLAYHNIVAVCYAVDHLASTLPYHNDGKYLNMSKLAMIKVVQAEDDKLLSALMKKLPSLLVEHLLLGDIANQGNPATPLDTEQTIETSSVLICAKSESAKLLQYSLVELCCAWNSPRCLSLLLKHVHLLIHKSHAQYKHSVDSMNSKALLTCLCFGNSDCVERFRDHLGGEQFLSVLLQREKDNEDLVVYSVWEIYVVYLSEELLQPCIRSTGIADRHKILFESLLQDISGSSSTVIATNLMCESTNTKSSLGFVSDDNLDAPNIHLSSRNSTIIERINGLISFIKAKLLLGPNTSLPVHTHTADIISNSSALITYLVGQNPIASALHSKYYVVKQQWEDIKQCLQHKRFALKTAMRKMTRKAVPSTNWLRVGYLFIRLISMIDDKTTDDCSSMRTEDWFAVEKVFNNVLKNRDEYDILVNSLLSLRIGSMTNTDRKRSKRGLLSETQYLELVSMHDNGNLKLSYSSNGKNKKIAGISYEREVDKSNSVNSDAEIRLLLHVLESIFKVVIEEHSLYYHGNNDKILLIPGIAQDSENKNGNDMQIWYDKIVEILTQRQFVEILSAQFDLENLQYLSYFSQEKTKLNQTTFLSILLDHDSRKVIVSSSRYNCLSETMQLAKEITASSVIIKVSLKDKTDVRGLLSLEDFLLLLLKIQLEAMKRKAPFLVKRLLVPLILPLCAWQCFAAATLILNAILNSFCPDINDHRVDLCFMSHLGQILPSFPSFSTFHQSTIFMRTQIHHSYPTSESHGFLLTPLHYAMYFKQVDFIAPFLKCFPLFQMDYLSLRFFVAQFALFDMYKYFIYLLHNLGISLFIPSNFCNAYNRSVFDLKYTGNLRSRANKDQEIACIIDKTILREYKGSLYNSRNNSIIGNIETFLLPFQWQYSQTRLAVSDEIDLVKDIDILLMDGCVLSSNKVFNSPINLARAMPNIKERESSRSFTIIHILLSHYGSSDSSSKNRAHQDDDVLCVLCDVITTFPTKVYMFFQAMVLNNAQSEHCIKVPVDIMLGYRKFYPLCIEIFNLIAKQLNIFIQPDLDTDASTLDVCILQNNRLYEYLVYYASYSLQVNDFLSYSLYSPIDMAIKDWEQKIGELGSQSKHSLNLKEKLLRLQRDFDISYIDFNSLLHKLLTNDNKAAIEINLHDPILLLNIVRQYSSYLYCTLFTPNKENQSKAIFPLQSFLQFSLNSSYERLDVFIRAKQILSILRIPFSMLINTANGQFSSNDEDEDRATLNMCESLTFSSFSALRDLIGGFYLHRADLTSRNTGNNAEASNNASSNVEYARWRVEECLLLFHLPFISLVHLGSSGLNVTGYYKREAEKNKRRVGTNQYENSLFPHCDDSFDLLKVLQREMLMSNSTSAGMYNNGGQKQPYLKRIPIGSNPKGTDLAGSDSLGLMSALDMAYFVVEFARYLVFQKILILITHNDNAQSNERNATYTSYLDTVPHHLAKHYERRTLHPLYAAQKQRSILHSEVSLLYALQQKKQTAIVSSKQLIHYSGYNHVLHLLHDIKGEHLRKMMHCNLSYSNRMNRLREVLCVLLTALLLDLGYSNYGEVLCRILLNINDKGYSNGISSIDIDALTAGDARATRATDHNLETNNKKHYTKLEDHTETYDKIVDVMRSLPMETFLETLKGDRNTTINPKYCKNFDRFLKEYERYASLLSGNMTSSTKTSTLSSSSSSSDVEDWKNSIHMLNGGQPLCLLRKEVDYLISILTNPPSQHKHTYFGDVGANNSSADSSKRESSRINVLNDIIDSVSQVCFTLSTLFWFANSLKGLLTKFSYNTTTGAISSSYNIVGKKNYINPLYSLVLPMFKSESHLRTGISLRSCEANSISSRLLLVKVLLSLGCSPFTSFPLPDNHISAGNNSSVSKGGTLNESIIISTEASRMSLLELAALSGDDSLLEMIFPALFPSILTDTSHSYGKRPTVNHSRGTGNGISPLDNSKVDGKRQFNPCLSATLPYYKVLLFYTLLCMPYEEDHHSNDILRKQYIRCIQFLMNNNFPVFSPSSSLSVLDLIVLKKAWPLLLPAYYGMKASSNLNISSPVEMVPLTTDDQIVIKFSHHSIALAGLLTFSDGLCDMFVELVENHLYLSKDIVCKAIIFEEIIQKYNNDLQQTHFSLLNNCQLWFSSSLQTSLSIEDGLKVAIYKLIQSTLPVSWKRRKDISNLAVFSPFPSTFRNRGERNDQLNVLQMVVCNKLISSNQSKGRIISLYEKCLQLILNREALLFGCDFAEQSGRIMLLSHNWHDMIDNKTVKVLIQTVMTAIMFQNTEYVKLLYDCTFQFVAHKSSGKVDDASGACVDSLPRQKLCFLWYWLINSVLTCQYTLINNDDSDLSGSNIIEAFLTTNTEEEHETLSCLLGIHSRTSEFCDLDQIEYSTTYMFQAFMKHLKSGKGCDRQLSLLFSHLLSLSATTILDKVIYDKECVAFACVANNLPLSLQCLLEQNIEIDVHLEQQQYDNLSLLDYSIAMGRAATTALLKLYTKPALLNAVSRIIYYLRNSRLRRLLQKPK